MKKKKQLDNHELESKIWMERPRRANTTERGRERDRDVHVFICLNLTFCPKTSKRDKHELNFLTFKKVCSINMYCMCEVRHATSVLYRQDLCILHI